VTEPTYERYLSALRRHAKGQGREALSTAYEIGEQLLREGSGLTGVSEMHHRALATLAAEGPTGAAFRAAAELLAEAMSPFESTHRRNSESNTALRRLNEMLDQQAKRIAHALHDEAGQLLATVHIAIAEVQRELPKEAAERLGDVRALLDRIEEELRQISYELRPTILDDLGLVPALQFLAQAASRRTGIEINVDSPLEARLSSDVEVALYRLVQESLTNVSRHSGAKHVRIQLRHEGKLVHCAIVDDGRGFDVGPVLDGRVSRGLGLVGMRERLDVLGGTLVFNSVPGGGTSMLVTIPLETRHAA
jgi:two-component system, NarL family, sensor histidine kinase UhpB